MDYKIFLETFFSMSYEMELNRLLSNPLTSEQENDVIKYIKEAVAIPLKEYFEYICTNSKPIFSATNITQASRISLCHIEMCEAMARGGNTGFNYEEIGRLLHNDDTTRSANTNAKFGENVKGAYQFGLTIVNQRKWYLSCLGKVLPQINSEIRDTLLSRTILRDRFYKHIVSDVCKKDVQLADYMIGISKSTVKRRLSSVKSICSIIINTATKEQIKLYKVL